jgi:hypothetical protein
MSKLFLALTLAATLVLVAAGCKSHAGSREYTPGQGWQQN